MSRGEEIFQGIDLEQLAGSDSPIIEGSTNIPDNTDTPAPSLTTSDALENQDPEAIDLAVLEGLEPISQVTSKPEEDGATKSTSQTPASSTTGQSSPSSSDAFTSFAAALKDAGVFSSLEEEDIAEINNTEGLLKAIEKQIKANEFSNLTEQQKEYLKAVEVGLPEDEVVKHQRTISQYESVADDDIADSEALQFELIRRSFLVKGFDATAAEKYAKLAIQTESSLEEALLAKSALVAHEKQLLTSKLTEKEAARTKKLQEEDQYLSTLKSKILEASEVVPGIKVNSPTKELIFNSLVTPASVDGKEPVNEVMKKYKDDTDYKLRLHAMHVLTKGFTDFSKFEKAAKSKSVASFEESLGKLPTAGKAASNRGGNFNSTEGFTSQQIGEALNNLKF